MELELGDIVSGLEPSELVEIRRIAPFGNKTLIEGVTLQSRRVVKRPLSGEEIAALVKVRSLNHPYDGNAGAFLLGTEAERIRIAHQFDPLFAVNSSIVDVLPHQVEAVYRYLLPMPRIRFLLADDTGAGKTIMAGLLIKELLFRRTISKVLIITPGGLTGQWQDEMTDKFGLRFTRINRASFEAEPGQFNRSDDGLFVTSVDFIARHEGCLNAAKEAQWDMIVVDEAHKLSAYEYGTKVDKRARYQAVEALASHTDHLLFLTATPHRGRKDTFRRLLMLLDDDLFQKDELVTQRIHEATATYNTEDIEGEKRINYARNRFFLRRLKEEMVDWDSNQLFKPRHTKTTGYELTPEELELYNAVTKYVRSRRKEAKAKRNRNVELTLMVMQRRLASSIYAITRTLQNRLRSLDEVLTILNDPSRTAAEKKRLLKGDGEDVPASIEGYEDLDEREREDVDKRIFRQVLTDDPEQVAQERNEVEDLYKIADGLRNHTEAKFAELLAVLDSSNVIRSDAEKLVIFTEHKDTMNNLADRLTKKGYSVVTIHGGMDIDARKQAQRDFKQRAKILVATDAAGEGINLQFCRFLINWDIPWNPNRLEQRMGRIHRYGQKDDVYVYNLVAVNTREGAVLQRILVKLDTMREQMGNDRVYDVIDELLEDVPLVRLMEKSIDAENPKDAADEAENLVKGEQFEQRAEKLVAFQKKHSLTSRLNLRAAQDLRDASDERRLQPCFIEHFFKKAYLAAGGTITDDKHFPVFHLGKTPSEILEVARQHRLPVAEKYETPFVFDKALISVASKVSIPEYTRLLGPGHPLFDALIEWAIRRARDAFAKGAIIVDPNLNQPQRLWLVRSRIMDGRNEEKNRLAHEQLSIVIADQLGLRSTSPAYLLNCAPPEATIALPEVPEKTAEEIQAWAYEHITDEEMKRVRQHRMEECDLRRQYLNTTFTELINELTGELNDLQEQELLGDDDAEERQKLEQRIIELKKRKASRLAELELMLKLQSDLPDLITSAIVVPAPVATIEADEAPKHGVPMRRDEEVERIGMEVTMRYERSRGWTPYDVSKDGEHYDIRSEAPAGEKRFIEVKGRAQTGAIILTGPEADKLRQLEDRAFLYVVTFCKDDRPHLRIIQNPMSQLSPEMLYRQVQFIVEESDWTAKGEEVEVLPT